MDLGSKILISRCPVRKKVLCLWVWSLMPYVTPSSGRLTCKKVQKPFTILGVSEMTTRVRVLAAEPDDLSLIFGTHKMQGRSNSLQVVL